MMRFRQPLFILLLFALALPACSASPLAEAESPLPSSTLDPGATQPAPATPTEPLPTPEPPTPTSQPLAFSEYTLSALLDYDARHLEVTQEIDYVNNTGQPLPDLLLVVAPNLIPGAFRLQTLEWVEGGRITDYALQGQQLRIPLAAPLQPDQRLALSLSYELNLPAQQAPFGYTERQTNLGDWYPFVPPYLPGEGWLAREDAYYGEHLAYDMADFQVEVRLARPANAAGQPLVVAATGLVERDGDLYRYQLGPARNFAWSVSHLFQVLEAQAGEVTVTAYSFPFHAAADQAALEATAAALEVFNEIFSPYPYTGLTVVEGDFLDGMEYSGFFFLSHAFYDYYTGTPENNLIIIAAHETAHQWWYGLVGNDQALEPWLDEALCTYSELFFYERVYPDLAQWWWDNRIAFHEPQGWVDMTIYEAPGFYPYRNAVYLRGAMFLHEIRQLMGDEAFFRFLQDYLERYTYRVASGDDFFALLEEHLSEDISGLASQYFQHR